MDRTLDNEFPFGVISGRLKLDTFGIKPSFPLFGLVVKVDLILPKSWFCMAMVCLEVQAVHIVCRFQILRNVDNNQISSDCISVSHIFNYELNFGFFYKNIKLL